MTEFENPSSLALILGSDEDLEIERRKPGFPGSLTDLHRFRKTVHGHDGSSRIVMVRKTDQRTFASIEKGQEPKLETITRETIETFRGQRTECKITTETKGCEEKFPPDLIESLSDKISRTPKKTPIKKKRNPIMDFQNECLTAHNEFRKRHGVPPLKLDRDMCKVSQQWANHLISRNTFQHSNNRSYGENLYCMTSSNASVTVSGREPVESWYNEIKCHNFGFEPADLSSGHFTQVVWKESSRLGVAFAKSGGRVVVVANYDPPGNYIGQFSKNVPPLGGFSGNNNHEDLKDFTDGFSKISVSDGNKSGSTKDLKGTEGNFEEDFLKAHNDYRKRHGVPPLKLDKKLCKYSEEWAKHLAARNVLEHRPSCNYGENIYCMYSSSSNFTISGHSPVDAWYEEVQHHPFGREPNSLKSGHFTQVIWKSSETLGVGVAKNTQGSIYVVANYSPAGNFVGHYVENVPPPLSLPSKQQIPERKVSFPEGTNTDEGFPQFALDGLKVHNEYRRKHGVPDLKLNKEMCEFAQEWADTCARSGSMCHRANNSYGENIFCVYSSDYTHVPSARDAVKEWYDEVKKHSFGVECVNHGTLHFTQIVWKGSTDLGFAMAKNQRGQTYIVANYNPRGNYVGQFVDNVPRARF